MTVHAENHINGQAQLHTPAPPKGTEHQERSVTEVSGLTAHSVTDVNNGDGTKTINGRTHVKDIGSVSGAINSTGDTYCGGDPEIHKPPLLNEKDPNGYSITSVFWCTRHFAVYEADNQVRIMLPKDYNSAKKLRHRIADLGGLRASIEDLRAEPSISSLERTRAAREVAWALAQALEDESDPPSCQPKDVLTRVDARLRSLVKSHYRKKYVLSNVAAFCAIEIVLVCVAVLFSQVLLLPHGNMSALHRYAVYGAFGGLGAFLSVTSGIGLIDVDINLKRWEHIFAGSSRILIGVVGALVIGLALDARFIDPTFGNTAGNGAAGLASNGNLDQHMAVKLIFAFIAGFSESLVPNVLRRGEQVAGASDRQNTPDAAIVREMKP
jgi:hypothetical protein